MTRPLATGYKAEADGMASSAWFQDVLAFADANIYQVWQGEPKRTNGSHTSRIVLSRGGDVAAAAEIRVFRAPFTRRGIAYVRWGPLWRRRHEPVDPEVFRQAIRAMRNEYVIRRRLVLRLAPRLFVEHDSECLDILADEGFTRLEQPTSEKTLIVDIGGDLEAIRKGLAQKWRNCLNKAERAGLTLTVGTSQDLFSEFATLYKELLDRKQFEPTADFEKHVSLQNELPDELKMHVVIARHGHEPCAGGIYTALGDTGVYLFGATNDTGLRTSAAYAVQWTILSQLHQSGVTKYDLNGISAEGNPGTFRFKSGLAGKNGAEATFAGRFQSFDGSRFGHLVLFAERAQRSFRAWRRSGSRPRVDPPASTVGRPTEE